MACFVCALSNSQYGRTLRPHWLHIQNPSGHGAVPGALLAKTGLTRYGQPAAYLLRKHTKSLTFSTGAIDELSQLA